MASDYPGIALVEGGNPQLIGQLLRGFGDVRHYLLGLGLPIPEIHIHLTGPGSYMYYGGSADGLWHQYVPTNDLLNPPSADVYYDIVYEAGHYFEEWVLRKWSIPEAVLYVALETAALGHGPTQFRQPGEIIAELFATAMDYPPAQGSGISGVDRPRLRTWFLGLLTSPPLAPAGPPPAPAASTGTTAPPGPIPSPSPSPSGATIVFINAGLFDLPKPAGGEFGAPRANGSHTGQDFSTPIGTPLPALFDGTLTDYELDSLGGSEARLTRPNGDLVLFAHCSGIVGRTPRQVRAGELVAYSGNSGTASTGPHVHLECRVNGIAVEPLGYCRKEGATGMTEEQLRALIRSEVESSYDLANTIAAVKGLLTKVVVALRTLGNL